MNVLRNPKDSRIGGSSYALRTAVACLLATLFGPADARDLTALETWGGRQAHPAVVNSVTAIPDDPSTLSLRGEWDLVENALSPERARAGGKAFTGEGGFWKKRTVHRVRVPGCLEYEMRDVHPEPEKGRTWFCTWDSSPVMIRGFHLGEAWYRRKVTLPAEWKGRRIWLKTGWTNSQGFFWINGKPVAFDWYGPATYKYDVTDLVRPGEREETVVVQVNNAAPSHRGNANSKNHWTGILRDVEFEATPADCWIDDVWVRDGKVNVDLGGITNGYSVVSRVPDMIEPWSPEHPNLYTARVDLVNASGETVQTRFERFGVRRLEVRGKDVFLNGKPFFFRGAGWHPLDPIHGYYPADRENFLKIARQIRAAGFNFVRTHTAINMPEFFEACDEAGLMVQPELPYYGDWSADGQRFDPLADAETLYRHYRRYPSFAVYSFGNEGHFGRYLSRRLYEEVKARDPDRLVNGQDCGVALANPINEPGASDFATAPWLFLAPGAWAPGRPYIYHEYINSSVKLDTRIADRFTGVWVPPITRDARLDFLRRSGLDHGWGDRLQDGQNLMQKIYLKYGLECARRDPNASGYSYWSLQDACSPQGGTFIGQALWDPFWGEKRNGAKTADVAVYNSPRCLLLSDGNDPEAYAPGSTKVWLPHLDSMVTNRVRMSGEVLKARFHFANFEEGALEGAKLVWRLGTVASGTIPVGDLPLGGVRRIGSADIVVPPLEKAVKAELSVALEATADGRPVVLSNSWDYWLFPADSVAAARREAEERGVVVCKYGSEEERQALAAGKGVVSLANQDTDRNITLGWWYMTEQMGAALRDCDWLGGLPHSGCFDELFFRIGRKGLKLPVDGFSEKDLVMVGEGGEACYLYLARRSLPTGARQALVAGLDVTADTPEAAAILRGAVRWAADSKAAHNCDPSADVFLWRGEKAYVWRDVTNTTPNVAILKPSSPDSCVRVGVAMPVRMEHDKLANDRVVWGGSVAVSPGAAAKIVAEITAGEGVDGSVRVVCGDETFSYRLAVSPRKFPAAKDRRTFLDIWQHPWAVARYFQVKPFSKAHYDRMRPLWKELADAGQKVITATIMDQPWAHQCFDAYGTMVRHIKLDKGGWRFDYSLFDEYIAFAKSCGLGPQIHCYTLCPFRGKRYSWEDERGHVFTGDFDIGSSEFTDYWTDFLNDFAAHLKAKGLFDDTYIALDERSPEEFDAAVRLAKENGGFKIALAANRPPSQFRGTDIDNFSIALECVTDDYIAETAARRAKGKTTTVYTAGCNPCTSLRNPPEHCQWLGAFAGVADLDGYLRWAFCSWPANPDSDAVYHPWFGGWDAAGGTYLHYPKGPSLRYLGLRNGLNLSEKLHILRSEGKLGPEMEGLFKEFRHPVGKDFPDAATVSSLLRRIEAAVNARP